MSRARPVASVVLLLLLLLTTSGHGALADAPPCSTTTTATYSLQVCLTKPTPDSTVSGGVGVSATAAILSGSLRVVRVVFTVDAGYTLTDYQSPGSTDCTRCPFQP